MRTINITLSNQQLGYINRHFKEYVDQYPELVRLALKETVRSQQKETLIDTTPLPKPPPRNVVSEFTIGPGTGKAVEVRKGQILRLEQVEGGQTVDLNLFSLNNRHERMMVALTRMIEGDEPGEGSMLWSNAPWHRSLACIIRKTAHTDTVYSCSCNAMLYAKYFDTHEQLNCQQMQHEAQREYGLQPYEMHDVFNVFQTFAKGASTLAGDIVHRNTSRAGDYIELYAYHDLLAVPNICGDDLGMTSNYSYTHIKAIVLEALTEDETKAQDAFVKARGPDLPGVRYTIPDSPLVRDETFQPSFPHLPLHMTTVSVELDDSQYTKFESLWSYDLYPSDPGAALRDVLMSWVESKLGSW